MSKFAWFVFWSSVVLAIVNMGFVVYETVHADFMAAEIHLQTVIIFMLLWGIEFGMFDHDHPSK